MQETQETRIQPLGWEDPLEKEMVAHASFLAWEIPCSFKPGRLQSMKSQKSKTLRVGLRISKTTPSGM